MLGRIWPFPLLGNKLLNVLPDIFLVKFNREVINNIGSSVQNMLQGLFIFYDYIYFKKCSKVYISALYFTGA